MQPKGKKSYTPGGEKGVDCRPTAVVAEITIACRAPPLAGVET
jgi:hypothetical protein